MSERSYIDYNFIKEIRNKKKPVKSLKVFSKSEIESVLPLLKQQEQELLMLVYIVSYMFFRPIEVVRIDISNIDFHNMRIIVDTKAKDSKTKIIPEIIKPDLFNFKGTRRGLLFDLKAKPDIDKRGYLTYKFKKKE